MGKFQDPCQCSESRSGAGAGTKTPPEEAPCRGRGTSDRREGQSAEIFCPVSGKYGSDRGNDFSLFIGCHRTGFTGLSGSPGGIAPGTVPDRAGAFHDAPITGKGETQWM